MGTNLCPLPYSLDPKQNLALLNGLKFIWWITIDLGTFILLSWEKNNFLIYRILGNFIDFLMLQQHEVYEWCKVSISFLRSKFSLRFYSSLIVIHSPSLPDSTTPVPYNPQSSMRKNNREGFDFVLFYVWGGM